MQTKLRLMAFGFGCLFIIILLAAGELVCRITGAGEYHFMRTRSTLTELSFQPPLEYKSTRGLLAPKEGRYKAVRTRKADRKIIYEVMYGIDAYGRRESFSQVSENQTEFAAFLGDSFTFGEGVQDSETLPSQFGLLSGSFAALNYGFMGYGPFDALARISDYDLKSEIAYDKGVFIYTFIDDHVRRTIISLDCYSWKKGSGAFYKKNPSGALERAESFKAAHPIKTWLYKTLLESHLFKSLRINFPLKITKQHIEETAEVIVAIHKKTKELFPNSKFYLVIYPSAKYGDDLISSLKNQQTNVVDLKALYDRHAPEHMIADEERHPSPLAYKKLAQAIYEKVSE